MPFKNKKVQNTKKMMTMANLINNNLLIGLDEGNSSEKRCQTCAMIHINKRRLRHAALLPLFSSVVIVFIVILTYVVCLIDLCVVKLLLCVKRQNRMCEKAKSQHMIFRCNVECTSLTTIVFELTWA